MATHIITEDDLADYVEKQRKAWTPYAASATVSGELKRLVFQLGQVAPIYRVTLGGKDIYIGVVKESAVIEYNAL